MSDLPPAEVAALRERVAGRARTGTVGVYDFDKGVIETLGARADYPKPFEDRYFIKLPFPFDYPPPMPGLPIYMSHPEQEMQNFKIPVIVVRRDDIQPAMQRWHPGAGEYYTAAEGAHPKQVTLPNGQVKRGWDRVEIAQQPTPFDFLYTVTILARNRSARMAANQLLNYVLRVYQPYGGMVLTDSIGDRRSYETFVDAISPLDEVEEVADRKIGFAISLRIEGELDLNDPHNYPTVTSLPELRMHEKRLHEERRHRGEHHG
jgi:hypothetical protein